MKSIFIITRRECGSYFGTPIAWIFIAMQIAILSFFFFPSTEINSSTNFNRFAIQYEVKGVKEVCSVGKYSSHRETQPSVSR